MTTPLRPEDPAELGPHRLVARLGQGGMGRVYLARSRAGRLLAVKAVHARYAGDPGFRARFRREVAAARLVTGAFTAPIVDADPDGSPPWLATAYVPGPSLRDAVLRHGPLPEGAVRTLGAGLAEALDAVHAAGLVHRDLKPSNVLLAADGPRLIDFGVSRAAADATLTADGAVIGSPGYLSPEQAEAGEAGPASDVFSLGATLALAATGRPTFGEGPLEVLLYRVCHEAPTWTACRDRCATFSPPACGATPDGGPRPGNCPASSCPSPTRLQPPGTSGCPGRSRRRSPPAPTPQTAPGPARGAGTRSAAGRPSPVWRPEA
ncbi:serine/threonine-protein kinase [Actinomadura sp. J1-007]|uniref:serine/threonine-protein kinase n=1 Tax=Actinomadura sp. J1-007 TaxID=2661913 RepID=UPI001F5007AA|nr:serine/threonine-protein kinase [Actinomadura sp. J1-007]